MNAYITNKISKNICLEPFLQKKKKESFECLHHWVIKNRKMKKDFHEIWWEKW